MTDLEKTQHYTTQAEYILQGLIEFIPQKVHLIEPFVGDGDLKKIFPNHTWEYYDIDPQIEGTITQDTLKNPPNYEGKWVITNPPFLAKNKAKEKELFSEYNLDDLYKISLYTSIGCEGGIFIVPLNFFTDEYSGKIRKLFLSKYQIDKINIFTEPVFTTTTYSVCAFAFHKKENIKQQLNCYLPKEKIEFSCEIQEQYDYRLAGDFFQKVEANKNYFSRLLKDKETKGFITNLKLYGIDTRKEKIRIEYDSNWFYGKNTDRVYLTFVSSKELSEETQREIMVLFNQKINDFRKRYQDIVLTNYRDYNRKRISFDFAYKLLSLCLDELEEKSS